MRLFCRLLLAGSLLLGAGCRNGNEKPVLNKEQMVPVLYAMMIADEVTLQKSFKDSTVTLKQLRAERYEEVFALYNTNREDFWKSLKYYEARPPEFKVILDSVEAVASRYRTQQYVK